MPLELMVQEALGKNGAEADKEHPVPQSRQWTLYQYNRFHSCWFIDCGRYTSDTLVMSLLVHSIFPSWFGSGFFYHAGIPRYVFSFLPVLAYGLRTIHRQAVLPTC